MASKPQFDLPDPLDNGPQLQLNNADALISQLAGQDIDRLISPGSKSKKAASPEELAAELDDLFDQIDRQELTPPPPTIDVSEPEPITLPEPVLAMRKYEEVRDIELSPRNSLLDPIEDEPLPAILKPLAWLNAPVAHLSDGHRRLVSVVSLMSFVASAGALVYVLMLRQNI